MEISLSHRWRWFNTEHSELMRELNRILNYLYGDDESTEKHEKHGSGIKTEVKIK